MSASPRATPPLATPWVPLWPLAAAGPSIVHRDASDVAAANTNVETTIYSVTVPGGTLGIDKLLRLTLLGSYQYVSGNNMIFRVKYGGTTIVTTPGITATNVNASEKGWIWWLNLYAQGATNAQRLHGQILGGEAEQANPNTGSFEHAEQFAVFMSATCAEDSTVDKTLAVTVQWNNANAGLIFTKRHAILELI